MTQQPRHWSNGEDTLIVNLYPHAPWDRLQAVIPSRTVGSIEARASKLKVRRRVVRGVPWSEGENALLRALFGKAPWPQLLAALPGRTKGAIESQGHRLRLTRPLSAAALAPRTGIVCQLRDVRRGRKIARDDLAEAIGVSLTQLRRWESGENKPRLLMLIDWAQALGFELSLKEIKNAGP